MLNSVLTGYVIYALGVALLAVSFLLRPRPYILRVSALLGGCTITALGAVAVTWQDYHAVRDMALPAAVLLGVL